jgi:hypothetical protein
MKDYLLADGTEEQTGKSSPTATSDHYQDRLPRLLQQHVTRMSFNDPTLTGDEGLECGCLRHGFPRDGLRCLAEAIDDPRSRTRHQDRVLGYLPGSYHQQASFAKDGFFGRKLKGGLCTLGTIHADHDGLHRASLQFLGTSIQGLACLGLPAKPAISVSFDQSSDLRRLCHSASVPLMGVPTLPQVLLIPGHEVAHALTQIDRVVSDALEVPAD